MLEAIDLKTGYKGKVLPTCWNFSVTAGELVLLAGSNGSGKSTLLRTLAGLIPPVSGSFRAVDAQLVPTRIPKVKGFTVRAFIAIGRCERSAMEDAMARVGISSLADRDISCLSDGEFQKACIASALARRPKTLLLDEPTAFLDVNGRIAVLKLLRDIAAGGCAVLFSSHDIADALPISTRVISIGRDGSQLVSEGDYESRRAVVRATFEEGWWMVG